MGDGVERGWLARLRLAAPENRRAIVAPRDRQLVLLEEAKPLLIGIGHRLSLVEDLPGNRFDVARYIYRIILGEDDLGARLFGVAGVGRH